MKTPLSSMLLVLTASVLGSIAAVLLKSGADRMPSPLRPLLPLLSLFSRSKKAGVWIAAGILVFVLSSVFYVWGLKDGSLTVLYPMVSLGYVWTLFWSRIFFHEPFNRPKILGLALVLAGVFFIGLGNQ